MIFQENYCQICFNLKHYDFYTEKTGFAVQQPAESILQAAGPVREGQNYCTCAVGRLQEESTSLVEIPPQRSPPYAKPFGSQGLVVAALGQNNLDNFTVHLI